MILSVPMPFAFSFAKLEALIEKLAVNAWLTHLKTASDRIGPLLVVHPEESAKEFLRERSLVK